MSELLGNVLLLDAPRAVVAAAKEAAETATFALATGGVRSVYALPPGIRVRRRTTKAGFVIRSCDARHALNGCIEKNSSRHVAPAPRWMFVDAAMPAPGAPEKPGGTDPLQTWGTHRRCPRTPPAAH